MKTAAPTGHFRIMRLARRFREKRVRAARLFALASVLACLLLAPPVPVSSSASREAPDALSSRTASPSIHLALSEDGASPKVPSGAAPLRLSLREARRLAVGPIARPCPAARRVFADGELAFNDLLVTVLSPLVRIACG